MENFVWHQGTNLFLVSGEADSGSQHSTKCKENKSGTMRETYLSVSLGITSYICDIAILLYCPLLHQRQYGRTPGIAIAEQIWEMRKEQTRREERCVERTDSIYVHGMEIGIHDWLGPLILLSQEFLICEAQWTLHTPRTDGSRHSHPVGLERIRVPHWGPSSLVPLLSKTYQRHEISFDMVQFLSIVIKGNNPV